MIFAICIVLGYLIAFAVGAVCGFVFCCNAIKYLVKKEGIEKLVEILDRTTRK